MNYFIRLPEDFRTGEREIEIHQGGKVVVVTEDQIDKIVEGLINSPLDKIEQREDKEGQYEDDFKDCTASNPIKIVNEDKDITIKIKVC